MKPSSSGILLFALTLAAVTSTRALTIPAAGPLVRIEGRTVATPLQSVRIGYPGVALHLCVRGTSLSVRTATDAEDADFDVLVDGGQARRITLPRGTGDTTLFENLTNTEHQVELVHCTESYNGSCEIESFTSPGEFLAPPSAPPRRLLFLGDSFTCGAAAAVRPGEPMNSSKAGRQNARLSYGWLLARQLSAQVSLVAYAGRGLVRDWQGIKSVSCLPEFYEYALPDDPASLWPATNYVPDVIGICVGNDFDIGLPDEVDFVRAYGEFVRKLRRDAPKATVVLIVSPILADVPSGMPRRSVLQACLNEVVKNLGDPGVVVADVGTYPVVPGDGHPDGAAHAAVADKLAPLFRRALE